MAEEIKREHLEQFGSLEIMAKQVVEGFITGLHKSPFHGFSVEFAEHRLYNTGESTRHVDWKLYARTEKLFTKKYEEETNLRCQMVLDTSGSMYYKDKDNWTKIKYSIYAIASLIELLKKQRDAVGLSLFSENLEEHTETKSSNRHLRYLFGRLEQEIHEYDKTHLKQTSAVSALHDIAELCHKRSLIMIFSDMLDDPEKQDELFEALQHLKHNNHEVILFHVVDRKNEIEFDFENRPYTLVDMESGEKLKLMPAQIKEQFIEQTTAYFKTIKDKCGAYGIDFMEVDVNKPLNQVLIQYLTRRQRMK